MVINRKSLLTVASQLLIVNCSLLISLVTHAAPAARTQSVIQSGTTTRARVPATGLYSTECYDAYYGCMDQFCITDNSNGGSCGCSDENANYEQQMADIEEIRANAEQIKTVEVERIRAGADEDIIFGGTRQYDAKGNIISSSQQAAAADAKKPTRPSISEIFDKPLWGDIEDTDDIANQTGAVLYRSANRLCQDQMPSACARDLTLLTQVYSRQITADCAAFNNFVTQEKRAADVELAAAQADVRAALKESFDNANKFDRGTCMVEFRKCMQTSDACGADWGNCVTVTATENLILPKTNASVFNITDSTMSILESKRNICENVLDKCVVVRDMVWPDFLREAAPTIRAAEVLAESKIRQSCLTDISDCIVKACTEDIAGVSMDACLSRPEMARSFCKVQVDQCEAIERRDRREPLIWGYVVDKLAAMRVDACTSEVKNCFTARCGDDFSQCIGMDYKYMHNICPLDSLVVCKANNEDFSMDDLDTMLMGLYLNVDNAALDNCQALVDAKMTEVCGSTVDCNRFAADDTIGTGSLRAQKDGDIYRITGMISFGSIKMQDGTNPNTAGKIDITDYLAQIRTRNASVVNSTGIISSIEEELNNIAGTVNRTINMIESDAQIQFCVTGRNLNQITGKAESTTARFPNLLNAIKMQIAVSALRQAQNNYNERFNSEVAAATKNASTDLAQYMCQMMPMNGASGLGGVAPSTPLADPYAISYEIGAGLTLADLTKGGRGGFQSAGYTSESSSGLGKMSTGGAIGVGVVAGGAALGIAALASSTQRVETSGGYREMWSAFNRETRVCHYCVQTVTKDCNTTQKSGFLGIGRKNETNCQEQFHPEQCRDIPM